MIYFYCQSYQAFNLAMAISLSEDVVIISSVDNIFKASDFLGIRHIKQEQITLKDFVLRKNKVDNEADRFLNIIGENEFHFSHTQYAVFEFYLIKRLNEKGRKTVFHNFEFVYFKPSLTSIFNKRYWRFKLFQVFLNIKYNLPVELRMSSAASFIVSLKLNYIKDKCYKYINDKDDYFDITLNLFKTYEFDFPTVENLFIAQTFTNTNFFVFEKIQNLLPIINTEKVGLKNHPNLGEVKGLENCFHLPDFLPVEFFFNKVTKNIISFHSSSLVTASKFHQCKTISLLDIVGTDDVFLTLVKEKLIKDSKNKIYFPQGIDEFKFLL